METSRADYKKLAVRLQVEVGIDHPWLSRAIATARRRERARARWTDALRWVRGAIRQAAGRRTARTSARPATLVATAGSLDRAEAPGRRRERSRAPPRRPQLRRAALCGPVLLRIVDAYEVYVCGARRRVSVAR